MAKPPSACEIGTENSSPISRTARSVFDRSCGRPPPPPPPPPRSLSRCASALRDSASANLRTSVSMPLSRSRTTASRNENISICRSMSPALEPPSIPER